MPFDFLYVCLSHFVIGGEQKPLFFMALRDDRGICNAILFAFPCIGEDDSKITQFKVGLQRRDG